MGCVTATAKRRRRQAAMGYRHLHPKKRPNYSTVTLEKSQRREARKQETRKRMQTKKRRG